jgi:hypothetical protein
MGFKPPTPRVDYIIQLEIGQMQDIANPLVTTRVQV